MEKTNCYNRSTSEWWIISKSAKQFYINLSLLYKVNKCTRTILREKTRISKRIRINNRVCFEQSLKSRLCLKLHSTLNQRLIGWEKFPPGHKEPKTKLNRLLNCSGIERTIPTSLCWVTLSLIIEFKNCTLKLVGVLKPRATCFFVTWFNKFCLCAHRGHKCGIILLD